MGRSKDENVAEVESSEVESSEKEISLLNGPVGIAFVKHVDGKTEDEVKMQMIAAGSTFKSVTRQFNELMISTDRAMSKKDKDEAIEIVCSEYDLSDENDFKTAVAQIGSEVTGSTDKSAASEIRAYAKKNELDVWKKPKGEGRTGFSSSFYEYLRGGSRTVEEATAFVQGESDNDETSENVKNHQGHYLAIHGLVQDIREAA